MLINGLESICIIGPGLVGGSLGLALRSAGFSGRLAGVAPRGSDGRKAVACGAVDAAFGDVSKVPPADLFVIATPIEATPQVLRSLDIVLQRRPAVVTDVCSTKREIVRRARRELSDASCFVGGHPMAGSEQSGVEFARADLFRGATAILTPTRGTLRRAATVVSAMWRAVGAKVVRLSPGQHDRAVAAISHLPHAVAAALVRHCANAGELALAGSGLLDTTRIASGDAEMWTQILLSNRDHVAAALRGLSRELDGLRVLLLRGDAASAEVRQFLARAARARDEWVARKYHRRDWSA